MFQLRTRNLLVSLVDIELFFSVFTINVNRNTGGVDV